MNDEPPIRHHVSGGEMYVQRLDDDGTPVGPRTPAGVLFIPSTLRFGTDRFVEEMREWVKNPPMILFGEPMTVEFHQADPDVLDVLFGGIPLHMRPLPGKGQE